MYYEYWEGISTIEDAHPLHHYPNPNTGTMTLVSEGLIQHSYTIYNLLGQAIATDIITANKQLIKLDGLADGIYLLEVKGAEKPLKFVIEK